MSLNATLGANPLALEKRLIEVFEENRDAVVRVKAAYRGEKKKGEDGKTQVTLRMGTGFFVSREGHVLVSASRAAGADRVWIEFKDQPYATEVVGHDRFTNVSVLRVLEPPQDFSIIHVDGNVDPPKIGAIAVAISRPLDFESSPSMGLVAGREKRLGSRVFPTEYIRTSISVDAGQGGCPILDINGRFIGMTVASIPDLDGSYCLPAAALVRVRDEILFAGHVSYSWMGFEVAEKAGDPEAQNGQNVYLSRVVEGAPADEAGLEEGDILLAIAGREIEEAEDVPGAVFFTRANQFVSIEVRRDGEKREYSVRTKTRPDQEPVKGARLQPVKNLPPATSGAEQERDAAGAASPTFDEETVEGVEELDAPDEAEPKANPPKQE
ncbi:MAG: S1C family serine protease [Opitutales bacterium]